MVESDDGATALIKCAEGGISFMITGWNMTQMSGLDFARGGRGRPDGVEIPILMLTKGSVREDILAALEAGVNNQVRKPVTPPALKEKIDAVLSVSAAA